MDLRLSDLLFIAVACFAPTLRTAAQNNKVPVAGDKSTMAVARAAIETARHKYKSGRLAGIVAHGANEAHIADLIWLGENRYADYRIGKYESLDRKGSATMEPRTILIRNSGEILTWLPEHKIVSVYPLTTASMPHVIQVTPLDNWFMFQDTDIPLERMLDPDHPKGAVSSFTTETTGSIFRIARKNSRGDMVFEIDLERNALPARYFTKRTGRFSGNYTWKRTKSGALYLANYNWTRVAKGSTKRSVPYFSMEITEWTETPKIAANRFEMASLELPTGTKIEVHSANGSVVRRSWIGGRPEANNDQTRELGEALRRRGFAKPRHDR